jgi:predicted dehydrogenase
MTIWACQAGKDVYVEKPCSYTLWEGRKMVEAARKYNRIVQVGLNRRSDPRVRSAVDFVRKGSFGKPYRAKSIVYRGRISVGKVQESSIPQGVHWDLYMGPAPYRAFTLNRFHYGWHYFWDTATGEVGNNGVHTLDVVRWGLAKQVHPVRIHCTGGQFVDDSDSEMPNVQVGTYEYEDGTLAEIDATTLYSPTFGGTRMGDFFYTGQGYVSSVNDWSTTRGQFTPGDNPDLPGGVSLRASNLSFNRSTRSAVRSLPCSHARQLVSSCLGIWPRPRIDLHRLKASSICHRSRYNSSTRVAESSLRFTLVQIMTYPAASSALADAAL